MLTAIAGTTQVTSRTTAFRHMLVTLIIALLVASALLPASAAAQTFPPGPTVVYQAAFPVVQPPAQADLSLFVLDEVPGAWTPVHTHSGQAINLVLDGVFTRRANGGEQTFPAGTSWVDLPGETHAVGNTSATKARGMAIFLTPRGAPLTTVQNSGGSQKPPPGPTIAFQAKFPVAGVPNPASLILYQLEFAPGAWTPPHTHGGQTFNLVIEGELILRENGAERTLKPGDGWSDQAGQVHAVGNVGTTRARALSTFLLPKDAPATTLEVTPAANAPAQPKTGCTYYGATQHNLCAGFRSYWQRFGGLAAYGYPLSEEFVDNGVTKQVFERARFEWHPGAAPQQFDVLLGRLGDELTANRRAAGEDPFQAVASGKTNCTYVAVTQHNLCAGFRSYWQRFGGLAAYGYPLSEEFDEHGVRVQYFERARFEWHSGAAPQQFDVLLGRVGAEVVAPGGPYSISHND